MTSGKTTYGQLLAKRMSVPFFDIDHLIETQQQMTINDIFLHHNEQYFRLLEREILIDLLERMTPNTDCVIALGGGTICFFDNLQRALSAGVMVYLSTPKEVILQRVQTFSNRRPLFLGAKTPEDFERIYDATMAERLKFYSQSHITHNPEAFSIEELISKLQVR